MRVGERERERERERRKRGVEGRQRRASQSRDMRERGRRAGERRDQVKREEEGQLESSHLDLFQLAGVDGLDSLGRFLQVLPDDGHVEVLVVEGHSLEVYVLHL